MNKELLQDAIDSLGLTQDEVDATYWMRGDVEILEYLLTKALYRTEYGIMFSDKKIRPIEDFKSVCLLSTYGVSTPVYRNINRHTHKSGDWTPITP